MTSARSGTMQEARREGTLDSQLEDLRRWNANTAPPRMLPTMILMPQAVADGAMSRQQGVWRRTLVSVSGQVARRRARHMHPSKMRIASSVGGPGQATGLTGGWAI